MLASATDNDHRVRDKHTTMMSHHVARAYEVRIALDLHPRQLRNNISYAEQCVYSVAGPVYTIATLDHAQWVALVRMMLDLSAACLGVACAVYLLFGAVSVIVRRYVQAKRLRGARVVWEALHMLDVVPEWRRRLTVLVALESLVTVCDLLCDTLGVSPFRAHLLRSIAGSLELPHCPASPLATVLEDALMNVWDCTWILLAMLLALSHRSRRSRALAVVDNAVVFMATSMAFVPPLLATELRCSWLRVAFVLLLHYPLAFVAFAALINTPLYAVDAWLAARSVGDARGGNGVYDVAMRTGATVCAFGLGQVAGAWLAIAIAPDVVDAANAPFLSWLLVPSAFVVLVCQAAQVLRSVILMRRVLSRNIILGGASHRQTLQDVIFDGIEFDLVLAPSEQGVDDAAAASSSSSSSSSTHRWPEATIPAIGIFLCDESGGGPWAQMETTQRATIVDDDTSLTQTRLAMRATLCLHNVPPSVAAMRQAVARLTFVAEFQASDLFALSCEVPYALVLKFCAESGRHMSAVPRNRPAFFDWSLQRVFTTMSNVPAAFEQWWASAWAAHAAGAGATSSSSHAADDPSSSAGSGGSSSGRVD